MHFEDTSVLSDELKKTIQGSYSHFLEQLEFKPRLGQRQMIAHIANGLGKLVPSGGMAPHTEFPPLLAIEAGTGTGKTLAYASAAIPIAKALGKKLIVSTATVALQEQIVHRDFPLIQKNSKLDFSFALAKGRRRYVCNAKLARLSNQDGSSGQDSLLYGLDANTDLISREGVLLYPELVTALSSGDWNGDRDQWSDTIAQEVWFPLTADNAECTGRRCPYISECCVYNARAEVEEADVIVSNHDLVLADIGLGGGVILPAPEDSIYIFDEAHNLGDKALSQFTHEIRLWATQTSLEKFHTALQSLLKECLEIPPLKREIETYNKHYSLLLTGLNHCQLHFLDIIDQHGSRDNDSERYRYPEGIIADDSRALLIQLEKQFIAVSSPINRLSGELEAIIGGDDPYGFTQAEAELWYSLIGSLSNRLEGLTLAARAMATKDQTDGAPTARWINKFMAGNREELTLNVSAVSAGDSLRTLLWKRAAAVVFTSATLQALGRFDRFLQKTGLAKETECHSVQSPFDYYHKGVLRVPADFSAATDRFVHTQSICNDFYKIVGKSQAVLVLFSARSQLNDCYEGFDSALRSEVLRQDDYPKHKLIEQHRNTVDSGRRSVIFGLASLAEGLDLPGKYCDHVVIAKLPFSVPNDPVTETESEWYESSGKNYFMEVSVPEAALKLVQASGRLLRTETDEGTITLLDNRVLTKRYGKAIVNTLPPYRQDFSAQL